MEGNPSPEWLSQFDLSLSRGEEARVSKFEVHVQLYRTMAIRVCRRRTPKEARQEIVK
jgi:hypothetical protein